jgi:hypothetical protein
MVIFKALDVEQKIRNGIRGVRMRVYFFVFRFERLHLSKNTWTKGLHERHFVSPTQAIGSKLSDKTTCYRVFLEIRMFISSRIFPFIDVEISLPWSLKTHMRNDLRLVKFRSFSPFYFSNIHITIPSIFRSTKWSDSWWFCEKDVAYLTEIMLAALPP